jgi:hypothetical protein
MSAYRDSRQSELFAAPAEVSGNALSTQSEPMPADFVARIRDELTDTLAMVRAASELPWKDLTRATLAELRFNSVARWLPADEATMLRKQFQCEMIRLYEIAERAAMEAV